MKEIWEKIYEKVIYQDEDVQKVEKELDMEISKLLMQYESKFNKNELEIIRDLMYAAESKSMQEGFWLGSRYILSLLISMLSES
ncbi:MAG: hypothetical protein HFI69_02835 [Lachnospiraceae bacterium]|nr:hypothetical protein [Lachnospiraceae bacterium]